MTLTLSNELSKFVLELNSWFTQYKLENILSMNSFYSIRLYELLKLHFNLSKHKNIFVFSIEEIREYFSCEKNILNLKIFVFEF